MSFNFDEKSLFKQSAIQKMPSFLETYTLHDSCLLEIRIRPSTELLVFVDWDLHWNKTISTEFNLLVIRFAKPYWTQWLEGAWQQQTLGGATSKIVSEVERERMLNDNRFDLRAYQNEHDDIQAPMMDEFLTRTVFDFVNWGEFEILHSAEVGFACFDKSGNQGEIHFENVASA